METTEKQVSNEQIIKMAKMAISPDPELQELSREMIWSVNPTVEQIRLFNREVHSSCIFDHIDFPVVHMNILK
jgi:hypothetical protein